MDHSIFQIVRADSPTSTACPCCGGPLPVRNDVVVDICRHVVLMGGVAYPFSRSEIRVVAVLAERSPRVVTRDQMLDAIYGHSDQEPFSRTMDVHIKRIRKKLPPGVFIETHHGEGYSLHYK